MDVNHTLSFRDGYLQHVQQLLLDAYIAPEQFSAALNIVAEAASAESAFLWLPKRDSEQKTWYMTSRAHPFLEDMDLRVKYPALYDLLDTHGSLAVRDGELACLLNAEDRQCGIVSLLACPVRWSSGKMAFVLGAINGDPASLWALERTALSFLLALDHYNSYHTLSKMGKLDVMTGLQNRNSYQMVLSDLKREQPQMVGCVYIDVNGLHEINNFLGHHAGDDMLRTVSQILLRHFRHDEAFRIGGDEFVLLCREKPPESLQREMEQVRRELLASRYEISFGVTWEQGEYQLDDLVNDAENKMRLDKQRYYEKDGVARNLDHINQRMEALLEEKRDADLFLSLLEPEFRGVYFVDLDSDTVRHIFIPDYFEEVLSEAGDVFSDALLEYARRYVMESYYGSFEQVCNYSLLRERLEHNELPGFVYQKKNGEWLRLSIVRLQPDGERKFRTLWTFSDPAMIKL